jgi:hypothetical protein
VDGVTLTVESVADVTSRGHRDDPAWCEGQAETAELFSVDRSTISRMMKEVREKELLKAASRSQKQFTISPLVWAFEVEE